jgi:RES domain-containing protein
MRLWRIGSTGPSWFPADLTGAGAAKDPGRWNKVGERVLYAAPTLAMAVLETVAHIDDSGLPFNKYVVAIDVPDDVWAARTVFPHNTLPVGWDAIPHGIPSTATGSAWYTAGTSAVAEFPSAIVVEEPIVVINAQHPDSQTVTAEAGRRFLYNQLFRRRELR